MRLIRPADCSNERPHCARDREPTFLPPIGTYDVFSRDENAIGIGGEPLERFVAFSATPTGNRIAFHDVVNQDPATVGGLDQRGASAGCFRVREANSVRVWDVLQLGDPLAVISN